MLVRTVTFVKPRSAVRAILVASALAACVETADKSSALEPSHPTKEREEVADPDRSATDEQDATAFSCERSPREDARVLSDECGVFVTPRRLGGGDERPGTMRQPFSTVQRAVDGAQALGKHWVFVCAATYAETVSMRIEHSGLRIFGGLACPNEDDAWQVIDRRASVEQPPSSTDIAAWTLEDMGLRTVLESIQIVAKDGKAPSESSVAMVARLVDELELRDVRLVAGKGVDGTPGANGVRGEYVLEQSRLTSPDAIGASGGRGQYAICTTGGYSAGGNGGSSTPYLNSSLANGTSGSGTFGSTYAACVQKGEGGGDGAPGQNGLNGTGALILGRWNQRGWHPEAGERGGNGAMGGGGGGGGAGNYELPPSPSETMSTGGGGGGGGGAGACGGGGGAAGSGGGASLSLVLVQSFARVASSLLVSKNGGKGGAGGVGHEGEYILALGHGQPGGSGTGNGCRGGRGGSGGRGGPGGGGAGGLSVNVLLGRGARVELDDFSRWNAVRGLAGSFGAGAGNNSGLSGRSELVLEHYFYSE